VQKFRKATGPIGLRRHRVKSLSFGPSWAIFKKANMGCRYLAEKDRGFLGGGKKIRKKGEYIWIDVNGA